MSTTGKEQSTNMLHNLLGRFLLDVCLLLGIILFVCLLFLFKCCFLFCFVVGGGVCGVFSV